MVQGDWDSLRLHLWRENSIITFWELAQQIEEEYRLFRVKVHCLVRAPGRPARRALAFKWQRLNADNKLEVTQKHGIWICLRNVTVTFESVK